MTGSLVLMLNLDDVSALGEDSAHAVDVSPYGNDGRLLELQAGQMIQNTAMR